MKRVGIITFLHNDNYGSSLQAYALQRAVRELGFEAEHILGCVYRIVRQIEAGENQTENLYRNAVRDDGNAKALAVISEVFEPGAAVWRGLGEIPDSGLYLRGEYAAYDGGSRGLSADMELPAACRVASALRVRFEGSVSL